MAAEAERFEPLAILAAFERARVDYVLIGGVARVLQGAEEVTYGVDLTPSLRERVLERAQAPLDSLEAEARDRRKTPLPERVARGEEVIGYRTPLGEVQIVPTPAGTQGYEDLRRRASREYLGEGVRVQVASINDLSRMLAAREREEDLQRLLAMRRLHELERSVGRGIDLGR